MDILSHGLYGGVAFGRKNRKLFWLSFLTGIAPDLLSFGIYLSLSFLGFFEHPPFSSAGGPIAHEIPQFVHALYDITHSLVVFLFILGIVYLMIRRIPLWLFAWPLHILVDIFTHAKSFFPTPFLWPISSYTFSGKNWGSPYIFIPNVIILLILYIYFFKIKKRAR